MKSEFINNSGRGKDTAVDKSISKNFNWGAFLLTWIWGIGNNTYITFLIIPAIFFINWFLILGMCIWFGLKGNEWAWKNKHFNSVEEFQTYQKLWATAGSIIAPILVTCFILISIVGGFLTWMYLVFIGFKQALN